MQKHLYLNREHCIIKGKENQVKSSEDNMAEFTSTRNKNLTASAYEAVFNGLAPDGGLYVPGNIPPLNIEEVL